MPQAASSSSVSSSPPDDPGPPIKKGVAADQTIAFDFTVTRAVKGGVALKFVLFAIGADASHQRQAGNTVLVVFNATPGSVGFH
ncbi:MAG TPA: hypothetical protein VII73_10500 [Caulobacteraceae bacterium]